MPQLNVETFPSLVFWLILSFGCLYLGLRYVIIPRISKVLEGRQKEIEAYLQKAEDFQKKSLDLQIAKEHELRVAYEKAQENLHKKSIEISELFKKKEQDLIKGMRQQQEKVEKDLSLKSQKISKDLYAELPMLIEEFLKNITHIKFSQTDVQKAISQISEEKKP